MKVVITSQENMFIEQYCPIDNEQISFTRQQGSDFAKKVADDFNPLHNIEAKRFCVPGDLLFSVIIAKSGLNKEMSFNFSGMVNDGIALTFPNEIIDNFDIVGLSSDIVIISPKPGERVKSQDLFIALSYFGEKE